MPLLRQQLQDFGLLISAGQISNMLTKGYDAFHAEKAAVKQVGLETARWISTDDTGARHLGCNGVTTQVGDDRFTSFDTVASKSRLMFLMTLRGEFRDYVINAAALVYLHEQDAAEFLIDRLMEHEGRAFADENAWTDFLIEIKVTGAKSVRLASEAAVAGSLDHHGLLHNAVIVSDGAGQFDVFRHGLCWIHAERLINRLVTVTDQQRAAVTLVRHLIWWFYHDLKLYRATPSAQAKGSLKARFDRIFSRSFAFDDLDQALVRLKARKSELLVVLDRPEVPLNTNISEQEIRDPVTLRKISGGTHSEDGRRCRDTFLSLKKTCQKNAISFWAYLGDRLGADSDVSGQGFRFISGHPFRSVSGHLLRGDFGRADRAFPAGLEEASLDAAFPVKVVIGCGRPGFPWEGPEGRCGVLAPKLTRRRPSGGTCGKRGRPLAAPTVTLAPPRLPACAGTHR